LILIKIVIAIGIISSLRVGLHRHCDSCFPRHCERSEAIQKNVHTNTRLPRFSYENLAMTDNFSSFLIHNSSLNLEVSYDEHYFNSNFNPHCRKHLFLSLQTKKEGQPLYRLPLRRKMWEEGMWWEVKF